MVVLVLFFLVPDESEVSDRWKVRWGWSTGEVMGTGGRMYAR